jgi:hypothetical protein
MSLSLKKCPSCKFWWFDRTNYGCTKQEGRVTYPTTKQWEVESNRITCGDFRSRKGYEYLLQKNGAKQTDRMIREGEGGEIENGKVSKAKRKITIYKKKKPLLTALDGTELRAKPKRMIRINTDS